MHLCSVLCVFVVCVCVCVDMSVLLHVHMCAHVCECQRLSSSKHPYSLLSILVFKTGSVTEPGIDQFNQVVRQ